MEDVPKGERTLGSGGAGSEACSPDTASEESCDTKV